MTIWFILKGNVSATWIWKKNKVAAKGLSKNERTSKLKIHLFAT